MTFFSSALHIRCEMRSVEEAEDLSTNVLGSGLVVVHDTLVGGKDENTELSGGEDGVAEVLELLEGKIETGGDDTALVEATVEVDNDLAGASIIDDLELVDVAVSLHDLKELNEDLGGGSQDNLNYILMVRTSFIREKIVRRQAHAVSLHGDQAVNDYNQGNLWIRYQNILRLFHIEVSFGI